MTIQEILLRSLQGLQPLLPAVMAVVVLTMLALAACAVLARGLWVDQRRFRWLGLFYSLRERDCVRLACVWVKLLLLEGFLVLFRKLDLSAYLMLLLPGLLYGVRLDSLKGVPGRLVWLGLELMALLFTNLVCGFYRDMGGGLGFLVLYICMALFTALFGVYLFFQELNDISEGRRARSDG